MAIEKVIIQNFKKFKDPFEISFNDSFSYSIFIDPRHILNF